MMRETRAAASELEHGGISAEVTAVATLREPQAKRAGSWLIVARRAIRRRLRARAIDP